MGAERGAELGDRGRGHAGFLLPADGLAFRRQGKVFKEFALARVAFRGGQPAVEPGRLLFVEPRLGPRHGMRGRHGRSVFPALFVVLVVIEVVIVVVIVPVVVIVVLIVVEVFLLVVVLVS